MKYRDYYATLGVEPSASAEEIRKAYRRLARQYHPDVSKEAGAEDRFKEVSEAYQTLSDPEKREAYDQLGRHRPGEDVQPGPEWDTRYWQEGVAEDVDLADLLEQIGFQRAARRRAAAGESPRSRRGQDYEIATSLTLEDAARGKDITVEFSVPELGPEGRVRRTTKTARIRVPKGVSDGERLRVPGKGAPGLGEGKPGDLYLDIRLERHPLFQVVGHDLYLELPIAPWEAVLGAQVELPSLEGPLTVTIPAGARSPEPGAVRNCGWPARVCPAAPTAPAISMACSRSSRPPS